MPERRSENLDSQIERREQEERERVKEKVSRDVAPASQGPVGPADIVGGPIPDERSGGSHVDSDAAGMPGVPPERIEKGRTDRK